MGLSASQARQLSLTARKSDLEYRGQTVNERRRLLAEQTDQAATAYSKALSNKRLMIQIDTSTGQMISFNKNIVLADVASGGLGMVFVDSEGTELNVNGEYDDDGNIITPGLTSTQIEQRLRAGTISMRVAGSEDEEDNYNWRADPNGIFVDELDDSDDEMATAIYEAKMAKIQSEDKRLELELKQVDTQHKTIQTELDAVKKVIDKNIQQTFKTFG